MHRLGVKKVGMQVFWHEQNVRFGQILYLKYCEVFQSLDRCGFQEETEVLLTGSALTRRRLDKMKRKRNKTAAKFLDWGIITVFHELKGSTVLDVQEDGRASD